MDELPIDTDTAHPDRPGTTTLAHPVKDIPTGTLRSIERQSGVSLRKE